MLGSSALDGLRALLRAAGGDLVVGSGHEAAGLARELGSDFRQLTIEQLAASTTTIRAAVFLPDAGESIVTTGALLAPRIAENGRLFLLPSSSAPDSARSLDELESDAIRALSPAGFVILDRENEILVARREPFVVRPFRSGDETQILPLFERSFHATRSVEKFRWIYEQNPLGNRRISLAFDQRVQRDQRDPRDRLVAQYAGYPVRFHDTVERGATETFLAHQIGDLMSDPSVRHIGRGPTSLFGRTARHYYAAFCEGQVAFNYGVNTATSLGFALRYSRARRLEEVPFHVRSASTPVAAGWRSRLRGDRVVRMRSLDGRFDDLFERVRGHYGILAERDAAALERRYLGCPDVEYFLWAIFRRDQLVGWSVFRPSGAANETLVWGDALFDPAATGAEGALLAQVLHSPEHRSSQQIETWLAPRPAAWAHRLLALGFEPRAAPHGLTVVYVPFELDDEEALRQRWYYTMGDFDLF